ATSILIFIYKPVRLFMIGFTTLKRYGRITLCWLEDFPQHAESCFAPVLKEGADAVVDDGNFEAAHDGSGASIVDTDFRGDAGEEQLGNTVFSQLLLKVGIEEAIVASLFDDFILGRGLQRSNN